MSYEKSMDKYLVEWLLTEYPDVDQRKKILLKQLTNNKKVILNAIVNNEQLLYDVFSDNVLVNILLTSFRYDSDEYKKIQQKLATFLLNTEQYNRLIYLLPYKYCHSETKDIIIKQLKSNVLLIIEYGDEYNLIRLLLNPVHPKIYQEIFKIIINNFKKISIII